MEGYQELAHAYYTLYFRRGREAVTLQRGADALGVPVNFVDARNSAVVRSITSSLTQFCLAGVKGLVGL